MRAPRFSIAGLMAFIAVCAVTLSALHTVTEFSARATLTVALAASGVALFGRLCTRGRDKAIWTGYLVFGAGYLVMCVGPWCDEHIMPYLVTTPFVDKQFSKLQYPPRHTGERVWIGERPWLSYGTGPEYTGGRVYGDIDATTANFDVQLDRGGRSRYSAAQLRPIGLHTYRRLCHCALSVWLGLCGMVLARYLTRDPRTWRIAALVVVAWSVSMAVPAAAQTSKPAAATEAPKRAAAKQVPKATAKEAPKAAAGKGSHETGPSRADLLRGEYGAYRANNDLLYYHLDVRVEPEKQTISGKNTIRFRMLEDGTKIQLDLQPALAVGKIQFEGASLKFEREFGAVFVSFPETLKAGRVYSVDFYYSGKPGMAGVFDGMGFRKDSKGRPWIYTSCEIGGASVWWPNKDQWRDEVESMDLSVTIPSDLVDVSNGRLVAKKDLGDGQTRWDWHISYPINNYCVSLNIGKYEHFADRLGDLTLDFYALPESLQKAKKQFAQAKGMLEAFQHYFGEYPFKNDGYKLIEVPYLGMEHQSAVAYGNGFVNGYMGLDLTGAGIGPRFDYIIIHESGHEWFGNSVSAADRSDMWIQEGWTTYLECLYVEYHFGRNDALKYLNGYRSLVANTWPIIGRRGENVFPTQDQYFKGALFLNTLRSVIDDDNRWWAILKGLHERFRYKNIMTEDIVAYFNQEIGKNLTPIFDQYLRHPAIPVLELKFDESSGVISYRWKADEKGFAMPVRAGSKDNWQVIQPTTDWQTRKTTLKMGQFEVATDLYYVRVSKTSSFP